MVRDECHPDVSLSDWNAFSTDSPYLIEQVLDRGAAGLPSWFLPLARGAAIPSPHLLRKAGYHPGSPRARGWSKPKRKPSREEVFKDLGENCLIIFRCESVWRIALDVGALSRPHNYANFALVHIFGSTPILTRTYQEATYLAEFCWLKGPPSGLCWVHECPDDMDGAIEFAQQRGINEAIAARPTSGAWYNWPQHRKVS
jgi:hypothetical protein